MGTDLICWSPYDDYWSVQFLHGHGQISDKSYAKWQQSKCAKAFEQGFSKDNAKLVRSDECQLPLQALKKEAGTFFEYDLYDECWEDHPVSAMFQGRNRTPVVRQNNCGGQRALDAWVSHPKVRKSLNVYANSTYISLDNAINTGFYRLTEKNLLGFYKRLVTKTKVRVYLFLIDGIVCIFCIRIFLYHPSLHLF